MIIDRSACLSQIYFVISVPFVAQVMIRIIRDVIQISATIYSDYIHSFVHVDAAMFTSINDRLAA